MCVCVCVCDDQRCVRVCGCSANLSQGMWQLGAGKSVYCSFLERY